MWGWTKVALLSSMSSIRKTIKFTQQAMSNPIENNRGRIEGRWWAAVAHERRITGGPPWGRRRNVRFIVGNLYRGPPSATEDINRQK